MTTFSDLTPRENEILQLVLTGWSNKAIAAEISSSEKTVEFYLDKACTKIGVRPRIQASGWATQQVIKEYTGDIPISWWRTFENTLAKCGFSEDVKLCPKTFCGARMILHI